MQSAPGAIITVMLRALFVERFIVPPTASAGEAGGAFYDAERGYTVSETGVPVVELAVADDTTTMTFVETEGTDSDHNWEPLLASVDTSTRARPDRDHWGG